MDGEESKAKSVAINMAVAFAEAFHYAEVVLMYPALYTLQLLWRRYPPPN